MTKGNSLHIGLNNVDPSFYSECDGKLIAAENDATEMKKIALHKGFSTNLLLNSRAKKDIVINEIKKNSAELNSNDIFLITFSGHGDWIPDSNGDEPDKMDEAWCLYDGLLMDDELCNLWSTFKNGVRILVISDSCHSGTIISAATPSKNNRIEYPAISRYKNNESMHTIQKDAANSFTNISPILIHNANIKATVLSISSCQDEQSSIDGSYYSRFTLELLRVWNSGHFNGNYSNFFTDIKIRLPPNQSPYYSITGTHSQSFVNQSPFTI